MHVIKLKTLLKYATICVAAVFCITALSGASATSAFLNKPERKIPVYCVDSSEKQVALTFDAAWGSDKTLAILDELDKFDARATFFLVGFWVEKYPDLVAEIDKRGHEIGTHSNTHPDMTKLSREAVERELSISKKLIEDITKKPVTVFRAPFGAYNNTLIEIATGLGLTTIQWDVDSLDWKKLSVGDICKRVLPKVKPGSIVLFHNNSLNVTGAIPLIMEDLQEQGYVFKSVGDILIKGDYKIDHAGRMYPAGMKNEK